MGLVDFFSKGAGQERRKWLDGKSRGLLDELQYYLGPGVNVDQTAEAFSMLNPVNDVYQSMQDAGRGDYVGSAINAATALAPVGLYKAAGAGAADDVANVLSDALTGIGMRAQGAMNAGQKFAGDEFGGLGPGRQGIRAYHGSPHDFDKFSMDKIGTGEGAQAYGRGLYFAENEAVARSYRDALTQQNASAAQRSLAYRNGDVEAAIADAKRKIALYSEKVKDPDAPDLAHRLLQINKQKLTDLELGIKPQGSMYEVNINADPDAFLDYDAPITQQPKTVRDALASADYDTWHPDGDDFDAMETGGVSYERLVKMGNRAGAIGEHMADINPAIKSGPAWANERLQGIPGIKYKDMGSRHLDGAKGSRNYVVFDESLIEIVSKYGVAGAAAMLGVSAAEIEGAMNGS